MKKILFIVNPIAGPKSNKLNQDLIHNEFSDSPDFSYEIETTEYKGHGLEIIKESIQNKRPDIIVLSGGDGTISEVLPIIVNSNIPIGILPSGSGNGLAHHLKIPINKKKALQVIKTGKLTPVDIGIVENNEFGKKYFHSNFGLGYDAEVIHEYSKVKQRGFFTYLFFMFKSIITLKPSRVRIELPNFKETLKPFVFTVANSSQYGYRIEVAPNASISDGLLDALLVKDASTLRVIQFAIFSMLKIKDRVEDAADFYTAEQISIDFFSKTKVQIDGEPFFALGETNISIEKHAVKILTPS